MMSNKSNRRSVKDIFKKEFGYQLWSLNETCHRIQQINEVRTQAFVACAYLTAGRIGELCYKTPRKHIKRTETIKTVVNGEVKEKKVEKRIPNPGYEIRDDGKVKRIPGVRPKDIFVDEYDETGEEFLVITLRNEKNKTRHQKRVTAPFKKEGSIINIILDYASHFEDYQPIFPYSTRWMRELMHRHASEFRMPHFLRALRCTHLITTYEFTEPEIVNFMGWSDSRPLEDYRLFFGTEGFMRKMSA